MTLTFDLPHDFDFGCFKVKFRNSSISAIVCLIDVKWKGSKIIGYWADCMTLPFDHTMTLTFMFQGQESEIALSEEWDRQLTWNEKDASHPFMTMILTNVTMVGCADVLNSDWGDFRHWHAIDISSQVTKMLQYRDHSGYGLSQWEKALHGDASSHWLSPYTEWSLNMIN